LGDYVPNEKILVVEDEAIESMDIKSTVESFGYSVPCGVGKGEEAVAKALELKPDLVLMDITLKGEIDGIKAAAEIKKNDIPVVFISAVLEDDL
jgi:CheY-like chemotaxis protein